MSVYMQYNTVSDAEGINQWLTKIKPLSRTSVHGLIRTQEVLFKGIKT